MISTKTCTPTHTPTPTVIPAGRQPGSSGQATTEMLFIIPLLLMILAGGMFIVFGAWQGIKTQQAANLAARMQGQERVSGGTSPQAIDFENGINPGGGDADLSQGNYDPNQTAPKASGVPSGSVYAHYYDLIKKQIFPGAAANTLIPQPVLGQNIDKVNVFRVIDLPSLPFFKWKIGKQIRIQGTAWGGEDTYMYGLPRWGQVNGDSQWKHLVGDKQAQTDDMQHP